MRNKLEKVHEKKRKRRGKARLKIPKFSIHTDSKSDSHFEAVAKKTYAKNQHKAQWWQSAGKTQFDTLKIN